MGGAFDIEKPVHNSWIIASDGYCIGFIMYMYCYFIVAVIFSGLYGSLIFLRSEQTHTTFARGL